ncbi:MAG: carboxypeptidase regulatory-like domain-containing protein [Gemmatimonas sp.]
MRFRTRFVAMLAVPLLGLAQNASSQGTGSLRGTVFDSLIMKPVPSALVTLAPGNRSTTANRNGEFSFEALPADQYTISYASPLLDSLGLGTVGVTVDAIAARTVAANIATPSLRTLWTARCTTAGMVQRAPADSGIVWGSIGDARSDTLLDGAIARFQWMDLTPRRTRTLDIARVNVAVPTGPNGLYFACGVPLSQMIETVAETPDAASDVASYAISHHRIRRIDFLVSTDMVVAPVAADSVANAAVDSAVRTADRQPRREYAKGTATVQGIVTDTAGRPVSGATVNVSSAEASVRTDESGRFRLTAMPSGTQTLEVRRIGSLPVSTLVQLRPGKTTEVRVVLNTATTLVAMTVRGMSPARTEFEERRLAGVGHVIGSDILEHRADLVSAMMNVPFVHTTRKGWGIQFNKPLVPFLDGRPTELDLVSVLPPDYFRAIEVIRLPELVPAKYFSNGAGVILFWSKNVKW